MEESEQLFSGVALSGILDVDPTGGFGSLGMDAIGHSFLPEALLSAPDPVLMQDSDTASMPLPESVEALLDQGQNQDRQSVQHDQVQPLDSLVQEAVDHLQPLEQALLEQSEPYKQDLLQFTEPLESDQVYRTEPVQKDHAGFPDPMEQDDAEMCHLEQEQAEQMEFADPLEQEEMYHSDLMQKGDMEYPVPIEQDNDMSNSEALPQNLKEQVDSLLKNEVENQICLQESPSRDQIYQSEPFEQNLKDQSVQMPKDQKDCLERLDQALAPLVESEESSSNDELEHQVSLPEPLGPNQEQIYQSEPFEQKMKARSRQVKKDHEECLEQSEQASAQLVGSEEASLKDDMDDQVGLPEPLGPSQDEIIHSEQLEQNLEQQSERIENDPENRVEQLEVASVQLANSGEPSSKVEVEDQMGLPEPPSLDQVNHSEPVQENLEGQQEHIEEVPLKSSGPSEQVSAQLGESSEPGSPTNMDLEDTSKDGVEEGPAPILETPFPTDFDKYYRVVQENPEDFTAWTYLLQYVEQENHIGAARKAFDSFFARYPYCYGYWKKYADMEKRLDSTQMADQVYRCGLQAIPLSVDLWLHFVTFLRETADPGDGDAESRIRAAYEHAVLAAGTDFRSDRLWESYVNWEAELGNLAHVTAIYDRVLGIPTQLYSHHFQRFREHVQNNLPKLFLSEEEFIQLRTELANMGGVGGDESTPKDDLPSGTEDLADPAKRVTEIENMRHRVIEMRQEVFNHNEHEVSKRWTFEEGIKRPYFHVKALEKVQLTNWKEYLDFEIENGTPERVVVLFERCLIACALYEDFWIKYAKYLENYSIEGMRHVYKKACTIHLPKKPTLHLLWAGFEELQGNIEEARGILKSLEEAVPGLAMVRLRRVSLERRHGNMEEAESLLQDAIGNGKNVGESSFYSIKLARQLLKVQRSLDKARKVLLEAIERDKTSPKLYLNLLELEYSGDVKQNEQRILSCFDRALSGDLPLESRLAFSQRKVEFLEDFGSDINTLVSAYEEHQKISEAHESTKRKAENGSQEPEAKRARTDDPSVGASQVMQPDMQTNHSAYNYNYNWYQQYNYQNPWGYGQYYPPPPT